MREWLVHFCAFQEESSWEPGSALKYMYWVSALLFPLSSYSLSVPESSSAVSHVSFLPSWALERRLLVMLWESRPLANCIAPLSALHSVSLLWLELRMSLSTELVLRSLFTSESERSSQANWFSGSEIVPPLLPAVVLILFSSSLLSAATHIDEFESASCVGDSICSKSLASELFWLSLVLELCCCCCCCKDRFFNFSVLSSSMASTDFLFALEPSKEISESPAVFWQRVLLAKVPGDCSGNKTKSLIVFPWRSNSFHKTESVNATWWSLDSELSTKTYWKRVTKKEKIINNYWFFLKCSL